MMQNNQRFLVKPFISKTPKYCMISKQNHEQRYLWVGCLSQVNWIWTKTLNRFSSFFTPSDKIMINLKKVYKENNIEVFPWKKVGKN